MGFKTRRAFRFIKAVIKIQRFFRMRAIERQEIETFEAKDSSYRKKLSSVIGLGIIAWSSE